MAPETVWLNLTPGKLNLGPNHLRLFVLPSQRKEAAGETTVMPPQFAWQALSTPSFRLIAARGPRASPAVH